MGDPALSEPTTNKLLKGKITDAIYNQLTQQGAMEADQKGFYGTRPFIMIPNHTRKLQASTNHLVHSLERLQKAFDIPTFMDYKMHASIQN